MSSNYSSISDDFLKRLANIEFLGNNIKTKDPDIRVEISRASTLLIASGFEEYIRQIATESCKRCVNNAKSIQEVPRKLLQTAWKRIFYVISDDFNEITGNSLLQPKYYLNTTKFCERQ